jgi:hypothetical protein
MKQFQDEGEVAVKPQFFLSNDEQDSQDSADYDQGTEGSDEGYVELSENEVIIKFSATLMNKLKRSAFEEGIEIDELASELITEGLAQRSILDAQRGGPSHLMTRTGYLPPDANGNSISQPMLSHHQNGMAQGRNAGNRRNNNNNRRSNNRGSRGNGGMGGNSGRPQQNNNRARSR